MNSKCLDCESKKQRTWGERTTIKCEKCGEDLFRLHSPEGKIWLFCYRCYKV